MATGSYMPMASGGFRTGSRASGFPADDADPLAWLARACLNIDCVATRCGARNSYICAAAVDGRRARDARRRPAIAAGRPRRLGFAMRGRNRCQRCRVSIAGALGLNPGRARSTRGSISPLYLAYVATWSGRVACAKRRGEVAQRREGRSSRSKPLVRGGCQVLPRGGRAYPEYRIVHRVAAAVPKRAAQSRRKGL